MAEGRGVSCRYAALEEEIALVAALVEARSQRHGTAKAVTTVSKVAGSNPKAETWCTSKVTETRLRMRFEPGPHAGVQSLDILPHYSLVNVLRST